MTPELAVKILVGNHIHPIGFLQVRRVCQTEFRVWGENRCRNPFSMLSVGCMREPLAHTARLYTIDDLLKRRKLALILVSCIQSTNRFMVSTANVRLLRISSEKPMLLQKPVKYSKEVPMKNKVF